MTPPLTLDRQASNIAKVRALHELSGNLLAALTRSGGDYTTQALRAEIALCDAAIAMWDDGDARVARENLLHELRGHFGIAA